MKVKKTRNIFMFDQTECKERKMIKNDAITQITMNFIYNVAQLFTDPPDIVDTDSDEPPSNLNEIISKCTTISLNQEYNISLYESLTTNIRSIKYLNDDYETSEINKHRCPSCGFRFTNDNTVYIELVYGKTTFIVNLSYMLHMVSEHSHTIPSSLMKLVIQTYMDSVPVVVPISEMSKDELIDMINELKSEIDRYKKAIAGYKEANEIIHSMNNKDTDSVNFDVVTAIGNWLKKSKDIYLYLEKSNDDKANEMIINLLATLNNDLNNYMTKINNIPHNTISDETLVVEEQIKSTLDYIHNIEVADIDSSPDSVLLNVIELVLDAFELILTDTKYNNEELINCLTEIKECGIWEDDDDNENDDPDDDEDDLDNNNEDNND